MRYSTKETTTTTTVQAGKHSPNTKETTKIILWNTYQIRYIDPIRYRHGYY